jgi:anthranilate synthase component 1
MPMPMPSQYKTDALPELPFGGGWFVFLAYELVRETEPSVQPAALPGFPVALAVRVPVALIRARDNGQLWLSSEPGHEAAIMQVTADIEAISAARGPAAAGPQSLPQTSPSRTRTSSWPQSPGRGI